MRLLVSLAIALTCATAASAQDQDYTDQVYRQLHDRYRALAASGRELRLETTVINAVDEDGTDDWTFNLEAGRRYAVIAACDDDCGDLDLRVEDYETEEVLSEDTESDATPVVTFSPGASGRCTIRMSMYSCGTRYCYAGFSLYEF